MHQRAGFLSCPDQHMSMSNVYGIDIGPVVLVGQELLGKDSDFYQPTACDCFGKTQNQRSLLGRYYKNFLSKPLSNPNLPSKPNIPGWRSTPTIPLAPFMSQVYRKAP